MYSLLVKGCIGQGYQTPKRILLDTKHLFMIYLWKTNNQYDEHIFLFSSSQIRCNGNSDEFGALRALTCRCCICIWIIFVCLVFFFKTMIFKIIYIEKILTKTSSKFQSVLMKSVLIILNKNYWKMLTKTKKNSSPFWCRNWKLWPMSMDPYICNLNEIESL